MPIFDNLKYAIDLKTIGWPKSCNIGYILIFNLWFLDSLKEFACTLTHEMLFVNTLSEGARPQSTIFFFKSGHKGYIDFWNKGGLQKVI